MTQGTALEGLSSYAPADAAPAYPRCGVYAELYALQAEQFTTKLPAPKAG
ncbi:hypothetical protein [Streptomyces sp. NPDC002088]